MAKTRAGKPRQGTSKTRKALAADHLPRGPLAVETQKRITELGLSREQAGVVVKDAASQMSRLMNGHFEEFSADRLVGMLLRLGSDVEIIVRHPRGRGRRGKVSIASRRKSR
jgi:predicted XRE-type DNA-binding protein